MGVMTMKMIKSTSITSTMGVTLMFELTFLPSFRVAIAIKVRSVRVAVAVCGSLPWVLLRRG
jgi:hypothetical protein